MPRSSLWCGFSTTCACLISITTATAQHHIAVDEPCRVVDYHALGRNPSERELRCRYGIDGPGRFGLSVHEDVPVYQPATPMPGTHFVGVVGQPGPGPGESHEEWEWRILRTRYGAGAHRTYRGLDVLDPEFAALIVRFEARLARSGVAAKRLETWRSPARQAFLFQQGRSRPGALVTTTLTSWNSQMDATGRPAGRAVDYDVPRSALRRFHEIAAEVGLASYGADSNDPGHVYLPKADALPGSEIALLRTIPRVPQVTLSTGLPVDERPGPGARAALRRRAVEFASQPFVPYPPPRLSTPESVPPVLTKVEPGGAAPRDRVAVSGPSAAARMRSVRDGASGAPSRTAGSRSATAVRNRGG